MSEEERPDYARLYRKGKPVGKIFEANALSEFRRKGEREEAQEEVRLLKGFNYWWHDKVRLNWVGTRNRVASWGTAQWGLVATFGFLILAVLTFMKTCRAGPLEDNTQVKMPISPLFDSSGQEGKGIEQRIQLPSKDTATIQADSTTTKGGQSPPEKEKNDEG